MALSKSYILGEYIDQPIALILSPDAKRLTPELYYYHANVQQSIMAMTDENGAIAESYSYDAYGTRTVYDVSGQIISNHQSEISNGYGYTGRRIDEERGLIYFRARYYSPKLGRFISRDPLAFVDGMNLYAGYFAMWGGIDPMGLKINWGFDPYAANKKNNKSQARMDRAKAQFENIKNSKDCCGKPTMAAQIAKEIEEDQDTIYNINITDILVGAGKTSGDINYNPDENGSYDEGLKMDPGATLAHEMKHAHDIKTEALKGQNLNSMGGEKLMEKRAMAVENQFRKSQNLKQRKYYSKKKKWKAKQY